MVNQASSKRYVGAYVNLPKQTRKGVVMEQTELEGAHGMTIEEVRNEVARGGKFVMFSYTMSFVVLTLQRPSGSVFFIKSDESPIDYGMKYMLISLLLGWWGIPFGPIYTIVSIVGAFKGRDVTGMVMASLNEEFGAEVKEEQKNSSTQNMAIPVQEKLPVQDTPKPIQEKMPVQNPVKPFSEKATVREFHFRKIYDENNVKRYNTLSVVLNDKFLSILFHNFSDAKIETKVQPTQIAENAPWYAMPINFLLTKGEKKVAILLVEGDKCKRYSVLETMELCKENGITPLRFVVELPNEQEYVVKRINDAF